MLYLVYYYTIIQKKILSLNGHNVQWFNPEIDNWIIYINNLFYFIGPCNVEQDHKVIYQTHSNAGNSIQNNTSHRQSLCKNTTKTWTCMNLTLASFRNTSQQWDDTNSHEYSVFPPEAWLRGCL